MIFGCEGVVFGWNVLLMLIWVLAYQSAETVLEILYPKIVQVIKFLNEHVLGNRDGRMTRFGRMVWPRLADAIIAGCLSKVQSLLH